MKRSRAGIGVALASLFGVLMLAFADVDRESPGEVAAVHGAIASLAGGTACADCHGGWFGSMQRACSECHVDIAAQLDDRRGLHGALAPLLAADCSSCHSEHHGTDFRLVNRLAFAQAGVADEQKFDHRRVGLELAGAHLELRCQECHPNAEVAVLSAGQKRYLGLDRGCASCHDDPHGGRMQLGCTDCHSQQDFKVPAVPSHATFLALDGVHAAIDCRQCHTPDSRQALEALAPATHRQARSCGDCHDSPHGGRFLAGNAQAVAMTKAAACEVCHPLALPKFEDPLVSVDRDQHAHSGFALAAPHAEVRCDSCHAAGLPFAARYPGRQPRDCRACHADPHGGQFDAGPFGSAGCVGCHATTHFAPHEFGIEHHRQSQLPLTGAHRNLDCNRCHTEPAGEAPRRFEGTPHRCEACHQDAHDGAFAASGAEFASHPRGSCAVCHTADGFAQADLAAFHHERHAGFAIDGAHAQVDCADCHPATAVADEFGRSFGRVVQAGAKFQQCATCHQDPHGGKFDRQDSALEVDGRRGCARCHDTASFRALPRAFAHGAFTGFELQGRHAELDCVACHAATTDPATAGRSSQPARGTACADCHDDPHQRQFEQLGRTDCSSCHKSSIAFRTVSFRHNLDARFALGDAHRQVPCAACHKLEAFGTATAVRYKPLPTECVDCHGTTQPRRRR